MKLCVMLDAYPRQTGDFGVAGVSDETLPATTFDLCFVSTYPSPVVMHWWRIEDANLLSNSHSVLSLIKRSL